MNEALIYRPHDRKLTWFAFAAAITIHLSAIAIATSRTNPMLLTSWEDINAPVIGLDAPPPQAEEVSPPEEVLPPQNEDAFPQESSIPTPNYARKKKRVLPIRSTSIGIRRATNPGSVKSLALYSPKPNYPYEARRGRITGSGIAQLTLNSMNGNVLDARMAQSTGSSILDDATVDALRRWRFQPGVATNINVPITYTLRGVSY